MPRRVEAGSVDARGELLGAGLELADRTGRGSALDALPVEAVGTIRRALTRHAVGATDVAGDAHAATALLTLAAALAAVGAAGVIGDAGRAATLLPLRAAWLIVGAAASSRALRALSLEAVPGTAGGGRAAARTAQWLAAGIALADGALRGIETAAIVVGAAFQPIRAAEEVRSGQRYAALPAAHTRRNATDAAFGRDAVPVADNLTRLRANAFPVLATRARRARAGAPAPVGAAIPAVAVRGAADLLLGADLAAVAIVRAQAASALPVGIALAVPVAPSTVAAAAIVAAVLAPALGVTDALALRITALASGT